MQAIRFDCAMVVVHRVAFEVLGARLMSEAAAGGKMEKVIHTHPDASTMPIEYSGQQDG